MPRISFKSLNQQPVSSIQKLSTNNHARFPDDLDFWFRFRVSKNAAAIDEAMEIKLIAGVAMLKLWVKGEKYSISNLRNNQSQKPLPWWFGVAPAAATVTACRRACVAKKCVSCVRTHPRHAMKI